MRQRTSLLFALAAILGIFGCSSDKKIGKDNVAIPTQLSEFEASAQFKRQWSSKVASDEGIRGERLRPAVADARVFVAGTNDIRALSVDSGKVLWRNNSKGRWSGGPGTDGKRVVVGSVDGVVLALDGSDGELLWRAEVSSEVLAAPAVVDDAVVVKTIDGRVRALNASDGSVRWEVARDMPLLTLRGSAAPLVADGYVYVASENGKLSAYALADGNPLWEQTVSVSSGRNELARVSDIDGLLAFDRGDLFLAGYNGQTVAVASNTGNTLWTFNAPSVSGVALAARALIVSDAESEVVALDRRSGAELWRQKGLKHRLLSAPVVLGEYVVVADVEGFLHALSLESGEFAGRVRLGKKAITMAPVSAGQMLIAQNDAGAIAAFSLQ
jgi:outer membrane protein assembly factor BamB